MLAGEGSRLQDTNLLIFFWGLCVFGIRSKTMDQHGSSLLIKALIPRLIGCQLPRLVVASQRKHPPSFFKSLLLKNILLVLRVKNQWNINISTCCYIIIPNWIADDCGQVRGRRVKARKWDQRTLTLCTQHTENWMESKIKMLKTTNQATYPTRNLSNRLANAASPSRNHPTAPSSELSFWKCERPSFSNSACCTGVSIGI